MNPEPEPAHAPAIAPAPVVFDQASLHDVFHAAVEHCHLTFLTGRQGAKAFFNLHAQVYQGLDEDQKHFLKFVDEQKLRAHLIGGNHLLGLYSPAPHNVMLAQARLTFADSLSTSGLEGFPFDGTLKPEDCAVIQTLGTHKMTNGMGGIYIDEIFDGAASVAEGEDRRYLVAKLAMGNDNDRLNNHRSLKAFQRNGFAQLGEASQISKDFYKSVFVIRDLSVPFTRAPAPARLVQP